MIAFLKLPLSSYLRMWREVRIDSLLRGKGGYHQMDSLCLHYCLRKRPRKALTRCKDLC